MESSLRHLGWGIVLIPSMFTIRILRLLVVNTYPGQVQLGSTEALQAVAAAWRK